MSRSNIGGNIFALNYLGTFNLQRVIFLQASALIYITHNYLDRHSLLYQMCAFTNMFLL